MRIYTKPSIYSFSIEMQTIMAGSGEAIAGEINSTGQKATFNNVTTGKASSARAKDYDQGNSLWDDTEDED